MRQLKSYKIIGYLLFTGCFAALIFPTYAQSFSQIQLDTNRVPWTQLSFHAKNIWVEVSTDIQLRLLPAADLDAVLLKSLKGIPIRPEMPQAAQMEVNTTIDPAFRSAVSINNQIWFNPAGAAALGRIRLRRGDDDFKKTYRFTKQGVFRHRIEPKNKKEASLEPQKWTDINDSFYPYDLERMGCSGVTERSLLIYIVSAAAASMQEDSLSLCVFGKRQLHRVMLRKAGIIPISISYIEYKQQAQTHREGMVKALKITLTSDPMESDLNEDENFSLLGFHKDISIYVDPSNGLPVQASGSIPTAGKATLKLKKVWLK
jgi:hypothetical protein